jgi:hypothetical protein
VGDLLSRVVGGSMFHERLGHAVLVLFSVSSIAAEIEHGFHFGHSLGR